jgi:hypothetical protein
LKPEDVDGVVFWTRSPKPFWAIGGFRLLEDLGIPWYVQLTHVGYHRDLEPQTPDAVSIMDTINRMREEFGPGRFVWRYDPIVFTDDYGYLWHKGHFDWLCRCFQHEVDEVTISYVELYRKSRAKMDAAGIQYEGLQPNEEQMKSMTAELEHIADGYGLALSVCSQKEAIGGAAKAATCVDTERLSKVAGRKIVGVKKGNRPDCQCAASRDIGAYDTCLAGCAYCYAVCSFDVSKSNRRRHDEQAESLLPLTEPAPKHDPQLALPLMEGVL